MPSSKTPQVFDLELRIDPASLADPSSGGASGSSAGTAATHRDGWRVVHVYGSPDSEERRLSGGGSIMRVRRRGAASWDGRPGLFPVMACLLWRSGGSAAAPSMIFCVWVGRVPLCCLHMLRAHADRAREAASLRAARFPSQFPLAPLQVHSLFPSPKTEEGIKGGVVLLRLAPPAGTPVAAAPPLRLEARYQDRWGGEGC